MLKFQLVQMNPYERARREAGFSQMQLATELGLAQHTISNIEREKSVPTLPTILKYAEYFADKMFDGEDAKTCFLTHSVALAEKYYAVRHA